MNLQEITHRIQAQMQQSGRQFFAASKKGEVHELQAQLNSNYAAERTEAIKRVIANMTVGKDVSGLFPAVLRNMQTDNLEQKKLVYLYLINYAKTQPDLVLLAVNTFVKDTEDANPLIRALAIRTMGVLRADKIVDYIGEPLRKLLKDDNPYVRKTAALCVAKLYDIRPSMAVEYGFVEMLRDLVGDSNPMVVANAITALTEIEESASEEEGTSHEKIFTVDSNILSKLLIAIGECTEWGRITILNAVAKYEAVDEKEAEHICERVIPQFQHANGSVVLAAIKVVLIHIRQCTREEFVRGVMRKLGPPLVTLVSSAPEVQWVALRNINLILQKRPDVLTNEIRVFFCKYNDPNYVKLEKLEIMIKLSTEKNLDTLLSELKEYSNEVDYDFVKKAIRAIGLVAIKIDNAAEKCINVLLELISTKISYVVQEAIIVIKDIFRKYPSRYEGIIPTLCANLEDLDEPEAKASLIWILGEYAEKIDNVDEILGGFLGNYAEESFTVQLQLLTAIVKLYLKKPESAQTLVQRVLELSTKNCDNADIRDRAYVYWRLLSTDAEAAKAVVLAPRPSISIPLSNISPALLDTLIDEISTLASVYHKPVEAFIGGGRLSADALTNKANGTSASSGRQHQEVNGALETVAAGQRSENLLDFGDDDDDDANSIQNSLSGLGVIAAQAQQQRQLNSNNSSKAAGQRPPLGMQKKSENPLDDLLGLFDQAGLGGSSSAPSMQAQQPPIQQQQNNMFGGSGMDGFGALPTQQQQPQQQRRSDMDFMGDLI